MKNYQYKWKKHIILLVGCAMIIMAGLWTIDISVSAMLIDNPDIILTNGFWERTPMQGYHIGIWLIFGASLVFVSETIWIIFNIEKAKQ